MGKSSGSTGGGGSGSGSATEIISAAGGVLTGNYNREANTFKSFTYTDQAFSGATKAQANAIATGKRAPMQNTLNRNTKLPAISVEVYTDKSGRNHVSLNDGRHRAMSAKKAGATHIRATVTRIDAAGNRKETVRVVKL
jgi:hypothetical protein